MFDKYDDKTRRRIYSLLSRTIDTNVKLGIHDPARIVDNFIKEINNKQLETWQSLKIYVDSKYFYNQALFYTQKNLQEYIDRYSYISDKGRITKEQVEYLADLIRKAITHKNYKVRTQGRNELKRILYMLSKSTGGEYIDKYKSILNFKDIEKKEEIKNNIDQERVKTD